jgi:hypothetical protein
LLLPFFDDDRNGDDAGSFAASPLGCSKKARITSALKIFRPAFPKQTVAEEPPRNLCPNKSKELHKLDFEAPTSCIPIDVDGMLIADYYIHH